MKKIIVLLMLVASIFIHNRTFSAGLGCTPLPTFEGCPRQEVFLTDINHGQMCKRLPVPCGQTAPGHTEACSCTPSEYIVYDCYCNSGYGVVSSGESLPCTCELCPANKYSGGASCISCPAGTTSPSGSTSIYNCKCQQGYYYKSGTGCTKCPNGVYNEVGTTQPIGGHRITECFLPDGANFNAPWGAYQYIDNCGYTQ